MTDAEYIYRQEIKERKRNGWGARNKKNGSKSTKCTLPHESMTRKEIAAMNGEVKTWNMRHFYTWSEFKEMPDDIQIQYINSITNRYGVGLSAVATKVFGKCDSALHNHFKSKGLSQYINKAQKRSNPKDIARLQKDVEDSRILGKVESVEETDEGLRVTAELSEEGKKLIDDVTKAVNKKLAENPVTMNEVLEDLRLPGNASVYEQIGWQMVKDAKDPPRAAISDFLIRMDKFDDNLWNTIKGLFAEQNVDITISVVPRAAVVE